MSIACRHPKVVMLMDNEENIAGAANIIAEQIEEYRTILFDDKSAKYLAMTKPGVLLIALNNVEKSVKVYGELVESGIVNYPHNSIILCNNKESGLAFRCCIKGLFDNYFVYQPLYERFRLKMIVHSALQNTQLSADYAGIQEEQLEQVDEEFNQLIEESSQCKNKLLQQIENSREEIRQVSEKIEQSQQNVDVSPQEILRGITEEHLKPLLNSLENDIKSNLGSMISQLVNQQQSQKKHTKASVELTTPKRADHQSLYQNVSNAEKADEVENKPQASKKGILQDPIKKAVLNNDSGRILVVEDNQLYRDMLVNVLSKEKYTVDEVSDGLKAIRKIKDSDYDLIIMDLFMPNLDGLNATKQIRNVSGGKDIPVIALTGNKNKEIVRKWAAYGLKGYIMKPSTREEILAAVSRCVA